MCRTCIVNSYSGSYRNQPRCCNTSDDGFCSCAGKSHCNKSGIVYIKGLRACIIKCKCSGRSSKCATVFTVKEPVMVKLCEVVRGVLFVTRKLPETVIERVISAPAAPALMVKSLNVGV